VCSVTNSVIGKKAQDRYVARVSYPVVGAQTVTNASAIAARSRPRR
jgi:hypothetical protein